VVLSDASEKEAARLASHFERMRLVFVNLLPGVGDDDSEPIRVIAVRNRMELRTLEPAAYQAAGAVDLAGFFMHSVDRDYILVRVDAEEGNAYPVVYHEYTHAMLRRSAAWMPLWLNEGLAQFYENTDFADKAVWLGGTNAQQLGLLKHNDMLPINMLLTVDAASPYYHDEARGSVFYAQAWALTHMLIMSDRNSGRHRVRDYMERLTLGEDAVRAATGAFGDLGKLQAELADYVAQPRFSFMTMPEEQSPKAMKIATQTVPDAEADAIRADVMAHTGRLADAETLLENLSAADATPGQALETLGYLRFRAGDYAVAKRWLGEAVAANPESYWARTYLALAEMKLGHNDAVDPEADAVIEVELHQALGIDGDFAPAYDALAMFGLRRQHDLTEAERMARRAVELEPGELSFRLDCAEVMNANKEFAEALEMLRQAMPLARSIEETAAVHDRIGRAAGLAANHRGHGER
jgi:tetratricopeptide (TPR) repeat protein